MILLTKTEKPYNLPEVSPGHTVQAQLQMTLPQRNYRYPRWRSHQLFSSIVILLCWDSLAVCVCFCVLRCSVLTLSNSIKGLNEGFDSSSGFWVGISAGVGGCGRDHGDAAPVTAVIRVRHAPLITLGPNGHNEQGCCVETYTIHTPWERRIWQDSMCICELEIRLKTLTLQFILWD